jgi:pyruvate formate-lyase/glycerol dehydratase family glycyl radical enzyme
MNENTEDKMTDTGMSPRIARMKERMLRAPYEVCMARALHFTRSYKATEGMDPHMRNALALKRTLERQRISIEPDEWLAGSKTERFLAGPLSVERGDFLRSLELEINSLGKKKRPFKITARDKRAFFEEVLPYWDGRTLRDRKVKGWVREGIVREASLEPASLLQDLIQARRFGQSAGRENLKKLAGPIMKGGPSPDQLATLFKLRHELAHNNPTPATFCFDVQGHLCLGVGKVVTDGMEEIINGIKERRERLSGEAPEDSSGDAFLEACIVSLEAAIAYAERFAALAHEMAQNAKDDAERTRLEMLAEHCDHVPRLRPRSFHEAVQSLWFAHLVGEIQHGTHEVFAPGRCDQYLYPFFKADLETGLITPGAAIALIQELNLKLTANVEPVPEAGSETNATLGNSQHCVTIGGLTPDGGDATNELSYLMLDAYEGMGGCLNQLSVRVHSRTPRDFVERAVAVFRRASGISFYGDEAIIDGLVSDAMLLEHARDYCIVGCVETSGHGDTHGCPGGHELTLPAVVMMALTNGHCPPPAPGQRSGIRTGDPRAMPAWDDFLRAFRRQLERQVRLLARAVAHKDRAYMEFLPAPYVSALMDGCIESARDITRGGARYDFTSLDLRGLATAADSLLAVRTAVYEKKWLTLAELSRACLDNFKGREALRRRIIREIPKFGGDDVVASRMALDIIRWVSDEAAKYKNERGGKFRLCFYSYGNHVLDGFLLPATPDGRAAGAPISNGISPSNQRDAIAGPLPVLRAAASIPAHLVSSGVALNMRFHPTLLASDNGLAACTDMLRAYFKIGGMHIQPNVVSTETLLDAQKHPEQYRDLVVKVSGYSAYFTDLGRSIQNDIIARTEHGVE